MIHGDDFTALGARADLEWYEEGLRQVFEVVVKGRLGEAADCDKEVRVLNRIVRIDEQGVKYEADPRHAEMLVQSGGLHLGNAAATPGEKLEVVDYEALLQDLYESELHARQLDGEHSQPHLDQVQACEKLLRE